MLKSKKDEKKNQIVSSMVCKLAAPSVREEIIKNRTKKNSKPIKLYILIFCFLLLSVTVYLFVSSDNNVTSKPISISELVVNNNPLTSLKNNLNNDLITVDQYGLYLRDMLVRYDSLPDKYKLPKAVVLNQDIYNSLADIWMTLKYSTRNTLTNDLPDLKKFIEKHNESLEIHQ